ncbi:MAG: hypothetical protein C0167_02790 [Nitrososphaera sp.]|nr:MAG: hypothetical protein C0167_02790 [Nitrososphaera sp.]
MSGLQKWNWREYERRLTSDDPRVREEAVMEMVSRGIAEMKKEDFEAAVRKRLNLVHEFVREAHVHDPVWGRAVVLAIAGVLQKCWNEVEHVLKHPSMIIERMGDKAEILRRDREAREWFYEQMQNLYWYLMILTWDVRCARCGRRIEPGEANFVVKTVHRPDGSARVELLHSACALAELERVEGFRRTVQERVASAPPADRRRQVREARRLAR